MRRAHWLAIPLLVPAAALAQDRERLLRNGDFERWEGGLPAAWSVSQGARSRDQGPESTLNEEAGALVLGGEASTASWRLVSQDFLAKPGEVYELGFRARAQGLQREAGQFDNCYVGLSFFDAEGRRLGLQVKDARDASWKAEDGLLARAPAGAARGAVMIFLSQTGRLSVDDLSLSQVTLGPAAAEALIEELSRSYPFFGLEVDHESWIQAARDLRSSLPQDDSQACLAYVTKVLEKLRDPHVWIELPDKTRRATVTAQPRANYDFRAVGQQLEQLAQIGRIGFVGRTKRGGFGYAALGTLQLDERTYGQFERALQGLLDAPGLIVDLRANGGGDEQRALALVSLLADKERVYAKHRYRQGPQPTDFGPAQERRLRPRQPGQKGYPKPIMVLTGPRCMSSGEGMTLMLEALPNVTLVGEPTRGASGNPGPIPLPGGITVWASRWQALTPGGELIERRGITPDVRVAHGPGTPTLAKAIELLTEATKR